MKEKRKENKTEKVILLKKLVLWEGFATLVEFAVAITYTWALFLKVSYAWFIRNGFWIILRKSK